MSEIFSTFIEGFTTIIGGFTGGIREAATQLIFETGADGARVLSDFAKFGFAIAGLGAAIGIVYMIVRLVRR